MEQKKIITQPLPLAVKREPGRLGDMGHPICGHILPHPVLSGSRSSRSGIFSFDSPSSGAGSGSQEMVLQPFHLPGCGQQGVGTRAWLLLLAGDSCFPVFELVLAACWGQAGLVR